MVHLKCTVVLSTALQDPDRIIHAIERDASFSCESGLADEYIGHSVRLSQIESGTDVDIRYYDPTIPKFEYVRVRTGAWLHKVYCDICRGEYAIVTKREMFPYVACALCESTADLRIYPSARQVNAPLGHISVL
jgi:hypothetical protein